MTIVVVSYDYLFFFKYMAFSMIYIILTRFLCLKFSIILNSYNTLSFDTFIFIFDSSGFLNTFRATFFPVLGSLASFTLAVPPLPRDFIILY